jgi:hypothetical protein
LLLRFLADSDTAIPMGPFVSDLLKVVSTHSRLG